MALLLACLGPTQSPTGSEQPGRQKAADALVAGVMTPSVMHSTLALSGNGVGDAGLQAARLDLVLPPTLLAQARLDLADIEREAHFSGYPCSETEAP